MRAGQRRAEVRAHQDVSSESSSSRALGAHRKTSQQPRGSPGRGQLLASPVTLPAQEPAQGGCCPGLMSWTGLLAGQGLVRCKCVQPGFHPGGAGSQQGIEPGAGAQLGALIWAQTCTHAHTSVYAGTHTHAQYTRTYIHVHTCTGCSCTHVLMQTHALAHMHNISMHTCAHAHNAQHTCTCLCCTHMHSAHMHTWTRTGIDTSAYNAHECTYACTCTVHTCAHTHLHVHTYLGACAFTYTHAHVCTHIHVCTHTYVCTHINMRAHARTQERWAECSSPPRLHPRVGRWPELKRPRNVALEGERRPGHGETGMFLAPFWAFYILSVFWETHGESPFPHSWRLICINRPDLITCGVNRNAVGGREACRPPPRGALARVSPLPPGPVHVSERAWFVAASA